MTQTSLFQRLLWRIVPMLAIFLASGTMLVFFSLRYQIEADYDAQMIADSHTVWTLVHEDLEEGDNLGEFRLDFDAPMMDIRDRRTLGVYGRWRGVRLWKNSKLAAQSENLHNVPSHKQATGFSNYTLDHQQWRIYSVFVPDHAITVEVWENLHNRQHLMITILRGMLIPAIIILPLMLVWILFGLRSGLSPLHDMARDVEQLDIPNATTLPDMPIPDEITPIADAINHLLQRVQASMVHEREFVDNVAHELRTPLAGLRLQGDLIAHAPDEATRQECIRDLHNSIDRASRLFDQLIMFSRLQHEDSPCQPFAANNVLQDIMAQYAPLAIQRGIDLVLDAEKGAMIHADPGLTGIMIGALIDNAIKYASDGTSIIITLQTDRIVIRDQGPGIPATAQEKVIQRFVRGPGQRGPGHGLGLALVHEICQKMRTRLTFETPDDGPGLRVVLDFKA